MTVLDGDEAIGTKARLLARMDDIEMIYRQILETLSNTQQQQQEGASAGDASSAAQQQEVTTKTGHHQMNVALLTELLVNKEKQVNDLLLTAAAQQRLQTEIDNVKSRLEAADQRIAAMHKNFKQAEITQATAVYHAKELLKKVDRAQHSPVGSEDLVKYAHKISASCSTVAPLSWSPGDPRRPYPQDIEMKLGWMGQCNNLPLRVDPNEASSRLKPLGTDGIEFMPTAKQPQQQQTNFGVGSNQQWHQSTSSDLLNSSELKNMADDAAELMSSDSSSSDSSDSSFGND